MNSIAHAHDEALRACRAMTPPPAFDQGRVEIRATGYYRRSDDSEEWLALAKWRSARGASRVIMRAGPSAESALMRLAQAVDGGFPGWSIGYRWS